MLNKTFKPSKHSGFTLIELVVVIVLLGILAAFALPRFANMTTDANLSVLKSMGGAIKAAANIVHAKAIIKGVENQKSATIYLNGNGVDLEYGYPSASRNKGISQIMGGSFKSDWTWSTTYGDTRFWLTTAALGGRSGSYINQTAVRASGCYILYDPATSPGASPKITYVTTDC